MDKATDAKTSKVAVNIVTWNSRAVIGQALESLERQTFKDFSVLIVDNASTDGTVALLKDLRLKISAESAAPAGGQGSVFGGKDLRVIFNDKNIGFAAAHNRAIDETESEYVLVMNPDVILTDDYIEKLIGFMDEQPLIGSAVGKIYKLIGDPKDVGPQSFSRLIDTTGLRSSPSRRFADIGEGKHDTGQFNQTRRVFGVPGALGFYRRRALEQVIVGREYFDSDFHSYKEDVDLAWRLQLAGWEASFVHQAIAYHRRRASGLDRMGSLATLKNRYKKPWYVNYLSNRNHLLMLVKNEQAWCFWWQLPWIAWYEIRKMAVVLLLEPRSLMGALDFFRLLPRMLAKRRLVQEMTVVSPRRIYKWFM